MSSFFLSLTAAAAAAKSLQSCPTLCNPIDGSPPGFAIPGILQAKTLEWVAISFSNAWKWKVKVKSLIRVRPFATPWTAAYQAPLSMGFSRQEYWTGVPLPSVYMILTGYKSSTVQNQVTEGHKRKCEKTRERAWWPGEKNIFVIILSTLLIHITWQIPSLCV